MGFLFGMEGRMRCDVRRERHEREAGGRGCCARGAMKKGCSAEEQSLSR